MKPLHKFLYAFCLVIILFYYKLPAYAQQKVTDHNLYSAGHAGAFVNGLFDAFYPYKQLELHGNFGLGAPTALDGELMMLNGKYYQTQSSGKTFQMPDTGKTPFAVVCFFHADRTIKLNKQLSKAQLFSYLDSVLNNQNGMYAIHISGKFKYVRTRAFPPAKKPYVPIVAMLKDQAFFIFNNIQGDFIGFKLPEYLEGPAISGYHFHFLSDKKDKGGHVVDLITDNVTIEIETLNSFTLCPPQSTAFKNLSFKKNNSSDIKSVENGTK